MTVNQLLSYGVVAAIFVLSVMAIFFILNYWNPLGSLIHTHLQSGENKIVWIIAQQAYANAELWARNQPDVLGSDKAKIAYNYASEAFKKLGIVISAEQIRSVIQLAWTQMEKVPRQQGSTAVINTELVGAEKVLQEAAEKEISKLTK